MFLRLQIFESFLASLIDSKLWLAPAKKLFLLLFAK